MAIATISAIIAGVSFLAKKKGDKDAGEAEEFGDQLAGFQDDIKAQKALSQSAVQQYNNTQQLGQLESQQISSANAMGKSRDSKSLEAIQDEGRRNLERDNARLQEDAELAGDYAGISKEARKLATQSGQSARKTNTNVGGLLTASRLFQPSGKGKGK